eukprot:COSAG06_NODE_58869_length_276_cov_0.508475_1_plen_69_part_01
MVGTARVATCSVQLYLVSRAVLIVSEGRRCAHKLDKRKSTQFYHSGIPPTNATATPTFEDFLVHNITAT